MNPTEWEGEQGDPKDNSDVSHKKGDACLAKHMTHRTSAYPFSSGVSPLPPPLREKRWDPLGSQAEPRKPIRPSG